jgi:signal transduction histidine kinase
MAIRRTILVAAVLLIIATISAATAEPRRVLLLQSFGAQFEGSARDIRIELDRQYQEPLDIYEVSLAATDTDQNVEASFADYLGALLSKHQLDLAVSIGGPATRFFQRHRKQLFPSTALLMTGLEQRVVAAAGLTANDTVIASSIDPAGVIDIILRALPQTSNVAIVIGNSPLEQLWLGQLHTVFQPFMSRVTFTWFNELSFDDMLKRAAALPPRSAILFALLSVDAAGVRHDEREALRRIHAVANAPIFSYTDANIGDIVGGLANPRESFIRLTASVAVRILRGEMAGDIKTPPVKYGPPKFDWREMQRWGISESRLPPGSEVLFRPATAWEQYRWQIIAIILIVLAQAAMITWLLIERHRRRIAETESRRRLTEVIHLNRTAAAGVLSASFAHEINQPLAAILSNAETAQILLGDAPKHVGQLKEILADIKEADERATGIIAHLRHLLKKKSDVELQTFDLNDAIRDTLQILQPEAKRRGVRLKADQATAVLPVRADPIHLQQVLMNLAMNGMDAMANCLPGKRMLALQTASNGGIDAEVSVSDSGTGIPGDKLKQVFETFYTTKQQGTGLGLSIARTIVETYGGKIWAENRAAGGAVFRFTLPICKAASL